MKATLTRNELLVLNKNLTENQKRYRGIKLAYAVAKNLNILKKEAQLISDMAEPLDGIKEYEEKRIEICKELSDGEDKGAFTFPDEEAEKEAVSRVNDLRDEYSDVFKEQDERNKELDAFLKEEIELELHSVSPDNLAEDLDAELVGFLMPFLEE